MDLHTIKTILEDSQTPVQPEVLAQLEGLARDYPYAQFLPFLYLSMLKRAYPVRFQSIFPKYQHYLLVSSRWEEFQESATVDWISFLQQQQEGSSSPHDLSYLDNFVEAFSSSASGELSYESSTLSQQDYFTGAELNSQFHTDNTDDLEFSDLETGINCFLASQSSHEHTQIQDYFDDLFDDQEESAIKLSECFVTESLAQIYIKQGKYPEAIEIFEKLRLKYPEKSVFFASQINSLEKNNY